MQSNSIADFGGIQWELFALTLFSWVLVYFALWKGITQARKVLQIIAVEYSKSVLYFCNLYKIFTLFTVCVFLCTLSLLFAGYFVNSWPYSTGCFRGGQVLPHAQSYCPNSCNSMERCRNTGTIYEFYNITLMSKHYRLVN